MKALTQVVSVVLVIATLSAVAAAQSAAKPTSRSSATLRIGLWTLWHDKEIAIGPTPEPGATVRLCASCAASPLVRALHIRAMADRLALDSNSLERGREAASVSLEGPVTLTAHGEALTLHNPVRISARSGELVLAVTLPVETYVERVVASESGPADTAESLKALAIVVRSFALHQPHGHADYDLCDSTHCQLLHWAGKPQSNGDKSLGAPSFPLFSAERVGSQAAHIATLKTAGETLWFRGQRAQAWFHQNCGGRTASPQEVWPGNGEAKRPMPWLGSRVDRYCTASSAREWSANFSLADLTTALAAGGLAKPGWNTLTVARRGESGRAATLELGSSQISAEDFRLAVGRAFGWGKILSTWFEISRQGDRFLFHGRGSGHGVGLCQEGAAAMSAQGRDLTQILAQYFPGAAAADESTGQPWQTFRAPGLVLESLNPADAAYLPQLSSSLAEAEARSGFQPATPPTGPITIRSFRSTSAFRDATLAPGWVAAFTEGDWIATQPLSTLAARKLLPSVLRHEFLHVLIESQAAPATPLWFREGLVEALDHQARLTDSAPVLKLDQIDHALAHTASEVQSHAAHRAAGWYAEVLLNRFGRTQVFTWLRTGIPASALAALK